MSSKIRIKQVTLDSNWVAAGSAAYNIKNLADPIDLQDAATKNYVDSVAAGLDPKESVRFATLADVGGTYNAGTLTLSGVDLTNNTLFDIGTDVINIGDRILIKDQADQTQNGIYVVTVNGASGSLERAADQNGTPANEVSGGNFTFVEQGPTLAGTGWVVVGNGTLTIDTDPIVWTKFSKADAYTAGSGIDIINNVVSADINTFKGLEFDAADGNSLAVKLDPNALFFDGSGQISISSNIAGVGLSMISGVLDVLYDANTIKINVNGELYVDETVLSLNSSQITDFNTASLNAIFDVNNFIDSSTVNFTVVSGTSVSADVVPGSLTESYLSIISAAGTSGQVLASDGFGNFQWINPQTGDITGVIAGNGLTGGGLSGDVTLDVGAGQGITVAADDISVNVDNLTLDFDVNGQVQIANGGVSTTQLNATGAGTAGNVLSDNGNGTMTWVAPDTVGPQPAEYNALADSNVTTGSGIIVNDPFGTDTLATNTQPAVYVNGIKYKVGNGTTANVDCWFANSSNITTAKSFSTLANTDVLVWSETNSGIPIDTADYVSVVYQKV